MAGKPRIAEIVKRYEGEILADWIKEQLAAVTRRKDLLSETDLRQQSQEFMTLFATGVQSCSVENIAGPEWADTRAFLEQFSKSRAALGVSSSETATFIFSLKQPIFSRLRKEFSKDPDALGEEIWTATVLIDKLGLCAIEAFVRSRQEIISRQQSELMELSTPVVKVWDGVLALPLIGTLDSARTQVVMESLLQQIVDTESTVAIIDITGVPTVDTLVAQHLLKTVSAARLMGTDCVISGIRPQIAQTMVHLGVAFADVVTKATLADAIRHAFKLCGLAVTRERPKA